MAQKDNAPAISLFSFQDIITSITGIMFLVVLLLVLLIVENKPGASDPALKVDMRSQKKKIESTRKAIQTLEAEQTRLVQRLQKLEKEDPAEIEKQTMALESKLKVLQIRFDSKKKIISTLHAQIRTQENELKNTVAERDQLKMENPKLTAEIQRLKQQLQLMKTAEKNSKLLVQYAVAKKNDRKPILVECGSDGLRILIPATKETVDFRIKPGEIIIDTVKFLEWAKSRKPENEYFVFLMKPASFKYVEGLNTAVKDLGFERGFEILPDNSSTIFAWQEEPK